MKSKIGNIDDLRSEILRLKLQSFHQEALIKQDVEKFKDKFRLPSIIKNLFIANNSKTPDHIHTDWVSNALRVSLPLALNKLVFGKSGFIIKSIVTLLSQKVATSVNKDLLTTWIDKASNFIRGESKYRREVKSKTRDYGIPPDSETY
ncbi:MAG: hypothetical protein H7096_04755 [Flavobacterium sp.]|nr:hypothetical protein [Pedobacter sp.]